MKWVEPKYSRTKVSLVGKKISKGEMLSFINPFNEDDINKHNKQYEEDLEIFSNWRLAHAYPMHTIVIFLRRKAKQIDDKSLVVQRLKRSPSIKAKLKRYDGMSLARMQDIAGCRAVVSNSKKAYQLATILKNSRTRNKLHSEKNYIEEPKESGYRGIHLVYKYQGEKTAYNKLFVEIQIRSKIQHSWATSVEVVGTFTRQSLKASLGREEWLDYFRYVSAEFSRLENSNIDDELINIDTKSLVVKMTKKLRVIEKLKAFTATTSHLKQKNDSSTTYYILTLDVKKRVVNIKSFPSVSLKKASEYYSNLEKQYSEDISKDVVLVSAKSVVELRKAYPNYFADTREFIKNLERIIG